MFIKDIAKKIIYGKRYSSETYIKYLRGVGVKIGEDCTIYVPTKTFIDVQYPWMITIGDHVRITEGVKILTHDYSWSVLKRMPDDENLSGGGILGASGHVVIGNNVFIGMNSIILRDVIIGDNVIIGVGSIVTGNCEPNSVYAGNPAKKIMSLERFNQRRMEAQVNEAVHLARKYYDRYGRRPNPEDFHEYFMLFTSETDALSNEVFAYKLDLCRNRDSSIKYMESYDRPFKDYEEFMRCCFDEEGKR